METTTHETLAVDVKLQVKDVLRYNMYVAYRSWFSKIILVIGIVLFGWMAYRMATTTDRFDIFLSHNILMIIVLCEHNLIFFLCHRI